jgi:endonuclease/exonuclease/phosphatase family metal-dependent hydrolase
MRLPFVLPSLLALALPLLRAQDEATFRVGTWNLEFLGASGNFRNNAPPRLDADYAAIGKKVVELGVCILAVQEINDEASLRKVAAGAGASWDVLLGTTGLWDDGKTAQRIGFLYDRAAVELLFAEELLQLPREFEGAPIFHRVPVTACWKHKASGCDFRLVTVHLKAGQKADDEKKRRGEATALAGWLDQIAAAPNEDPDVVLLGDFNSTYGAEPEQLFEKSGKRRYLQDAQPTPTIMHFDAPIDQIVVANGCSESRAHTFTVASDFRGLTKDAWRQTYSDHFPVTVLLAARGDDDPQATFARGGPEQALPRAAGAATAAPAVAAARRDAWPPKLGQAVRVGVGTSWIEGRLAAPVPEGPGGWIVIEVSGKVHAYPLAQVTSLVLQ